MENLTQQTPLPMSPPFGVTNDTEPSPPAESDTSPTALPQDYQQGILQDFPKAAVQHVDKNDATEVTERRISRVPGGDFSALIVEWKTNIISLYYHFL